MYDDLIRGPRGGRVRTAILAGVGSAMALLMTSELMTGTHGSSEYGNATIEKCGPYYRYLDMDFLERNAALGCLAPGG